MKELEKFNWIFNKRISNKELESMEDFLIRGEEIVCGYKTIRDVAIFTTKRVIIRDKQGFRGKKIETYTIPYKSIDMYSVENSGTFDLTAEVELWTKAGHMKLNFKSDFNIALINKVIATEVLK